MRHKLTVSVADPYMRQGRRNHHPMVKNLWCIVQALLILWKSHTDEAHYTYPSCRIAGGGCPFRVHCYTQKESVQYLSGVERFPPHTPMSIRGASTDLEGLLHRFVPEKALSEVCTMLREHPHHLEITPGRSSKYGDFSIDYPSGRPRISVNGNLNSYSFLITLTHELAHLLTWKQHKDAVKPHGPEWKNAFRQTLGPFLNKDIFPPDVERAVMRYLHNPAASTCSDTHLAAVLSRYDRNTNPDVKLISEIPIHTRFVYGKDQRIFVKGEQLRKRYQCRCERTKAIYLFSPIAKIKVLN